MVRWCDGEVVRYVNITTYISQHLNTSTPQHYLLNPLRRMRVSTCLVLKVKSPPIIQL